MPLTSPVVFNTVLKHASFTSIVVFDPDGIIQDINDGFQKTFGFTRESVIGKNIALLYSQNDLDKDLPDRMIKETMSSGSRHDERYLNRHDGSPIWVHMECIYAKDENGQEYLAKIITDINKEKLLGQKLQEKNELQEKAIKDNETFIYTASHDLSSPVSNIEGLLTTLGEVYHDPAEVKLLIPLLRASVERLKNKIGELSAIGRIQEEGKGKAAYAAFQKSFEDVLFFLEEEIKTSEAEVSADFSGAPTVNFSQKNLKSVLQNLISNAIKYRHPQRKPVISLWTERGDKGNVVLHVRDNGRGIEPKDQERIFHMYKRAHFDVEGTGVGLGIVKKIIDDSGGKIELESKVGEGSVFKIYIQDTKDS